MKPIDIFLKALSGRRNTRIVAQKTTLPTRLPGFKKVVMKIYEIDGESKTLLCADETVGNVGLDNDLHRAEEDVSVKVIEKLLESLGI